MEAAVLLLHSLGAAPYTGTSACTVLLHCSGSKSQIVWEESQGNLTCWKKKWKMQQISPLMVVFLVMRIMLTTRPWSGPNLNSFSHLDIGNAECSDGEELKHFSRYRRATPSSVSSLGETAEGTLPWLPSWTDNSFFPVILWPKRGPQCQLSFSPFFHEGMPTVVPAGQPPPPMVCAFTSLFKISCGPGAVLPLLSGSWPAADTPGVSCQNPCHYPTRLSGKGPCWG